MDHSEEAVGQLIVSGGDGAVDLNLSEHSLDAIALLVERPIMLDFHAAVSPARNDCLDLALRKVSTDCIGVEKGVRYALGQADQGVIGLAICCLADRQMERERSSEGITQAVNFTGEPVPRAVKSASMSPPFPPAAETCEVAPVFWAGCKATPDVIDWYGNQDDEEAPQRAAGNQAQRAPHDDRVLEAAGH